MPSDELGFLQRQMDKCKMSGMGTRLDRLFLWCLFPAIIVDIIIHGDDWDEYYDNDPLMSDIMEYWHSYED